MQFLVWLQSRPIAVWVGESQSLFAYPGVLLLHTIGLAMVVGPSVVLNLRLLGVGRRIPLATLKNVFPLMWVGFAINASSGIVLFAAAAELTGVKPVFYVKLGLILLAMITVTRIRRSVFGNPLMPDPDAPIPAIVKILAGTLLILWGAAITAGRYTAYL